MTCERKTVPLPARCPWCSVENTRATNLVGATPHPGAFSICGACSQPAVFTENLSVLRKLERHEILALDYDMAEAILVAMAAVQRSWSTGQRH